MERRRKHIPLTERLAATLACLLPRAQRDELRAKEAPAREVLRKFDFHHVRLHAWAGSDKWHNLHPMPRGEHAEQTRGDISRAAKVVRNEKKWGAFMRAVDKGRKPPPRPSRWRRRR